MEKSGDAMKQYYDNYWAIRDFKKEIRNRPRKKFIKFYPLANFDRPSQAHRVWMEYVLSADKVLDFGAGDLRFKEFAKHNKFKGEYRTLDIGKDFTYDFNNLDDIKEKFDLVLCFEVIEHMDLVSFLNFLKKLKDKLNKGGKIIITTPNAHHINHFWKTDVTHLRPYPYEDLYALLRINGFKDIIMYRIVWWAGAGAFFHLEFNLRRMLTHVLGVDYATNIGFVASL